MALFVVSSLLFKRIGRVILIVQLQHDRLDLVTLILNPISSQLPKLITITSDDHVGTFDRPWDVAFSRYDLSVLLREELHHSIASAGPVFLILFDFLVELLLALEPRLLGLHGHGCWFQRF